MTKPIRYAPLKDLRSLAAKRLSVVKVSAKWEMELAELAGGTVRVHDDLGIEEPGRTG